MSIDYLLFNSLPNTRLLDSIVVLHTAIFGTSDDLTRKMENKAGLLVIIAMSDEKVIGYKIGYALEDTKFYSWLGGVDTNFRKFGIGSTLMEKQHQYLRDNGYSAVQTKTMNRWHSSSYRLLGRILTHAGNYCNSPNTSPSFINLNKKNAHMDVIADHFFIYRRSLFFSLIFHSPISDPSQSFTIKGPENTAFPLSFLNVSFFTINFSCKRCLKRFATELSDVTTWINDPLSV